MVLWHWYVIYGALTGCTTVEASHITEFEIICPRMSQSVAVSCLARLLHTKYTTG